MKFVYIGRTKTPLLIKGELTSPADKSVKILCSEHPDTFAIFGRRCPGAYFTRYTIKGGYGNQSAATVLPDITTFDLDAN
jgi:hypothetical protein